MDGWREKSGRAVVSERLVEDRDGVRVLSWTIERVKRWEKDRRRRTWRNGKVGGKGGRMEAWWKGRKRGR